MNGPGDRGPTTADGAVGHCPSVVDPVVHVSSARRGAGNGTGWHATGPPSWNSVKTSWWSHGRNSMRCTTSCTCWPVPSMTSNETSRQARRRRRPSCRRHCTGCSRLHAHCGTERSVQLPLPDNAHNLRYVTSGIRLDGRVRMDQTDHSSDEPDDQAGRNSRGQLDIEVTRTSSRGAVRADRHLHREVQELRPPCLTSRRHSHRPRQRRHRRPARTACEVVVRSFVASAW
jgi:hypothetical protein